MVGQDEPSQHLSDLTGLQATLAFCAVSSFISIASAEIQLQ